uniref:Uncharacterized protein n=1 Tax=Myripristis murdjan TaxID=586833 RepID=A0A667X811_9TELE
MNKFHPITVGKTLGAEIAFIEKLKAFGQIEVTSPELCDYFLVFCPIESRVGTDISGAICVLLVLAGGKQVILVVMHHTMRPDDFAGDSRRHVTRPDIVLTVDCLFFEGRFLDCDRNKIAFRDIKKTFFQVYYWCFKKDIWHKTEDKTRVGYPKMKSKTF